MIACRQRSKRHLSVKGRAAYQWALLNSNDDLAEYLIDKVATVANLETEDTVIAHIKDGSIPIEEVLRLIGETTSLDAVQRRHPSALHEAAGRNDILAATRLLATGFDANSMICRTYLHEAAFHRYIEMAELLIANGAGVSRRDERHHTTLIGWAEYSGQSVMIRFLSDYSYVAGAATSEIVKSAALRDVYSYSFKRGCFVGQSGGELQSLTDWR